MKFLIIGCPRSGTTYIRSVLVKAGYNMGSESEDGSDGRVTYLYGAGTGSEYKNYGPILHQIRNPIDFVKSMPVVNDLSFRYLIGSCKHSCNTYGILDNIRVNDFRKLRTLCLIWYFWNESCEKRSVFSYRVEDLSNVLDKFNKFLPNEVTVDHLNLVSKKTNTRTMRKEYKHFNLDQIKKACGNFFPLFKIKVEFYGYEVG